MLCAWHQCSSCDSPVRAGDDSAARHWLGRHIGDAVAMAGLRQWAATAGLLAAPATADDQALADCLAAAIGSGALRVCGPASTPKLYNLAILRAPAASAAPATAASPPAQPRPTAAAAATPAESTFSAGLDSAEMAAALVRAAQDGAPFCEECAKAASARAAASAGA